LSTGKIDQYGPAESDAASAATRADRHRIQIALIAE